METENPVVPRLPSPAPKAQKRKAFGKVALGGLVGALIGGGIGFLGAKMGAQLFLPGLPKSWAFLHLALLPVYWLLAVAIHELGHLVGGWLGGGRFLLYVVGPLMWKQTPSGVRFNWNTNVNTFGGLAACLPLDPAKSTPRHTAAMVAGGPLASLVLTVVAAWVSAGFAAIATSPALVFAQHATLMAAGVSALIFLVTMVPGTGGGFKTDGLRFYELVRGDQQSEQENAVMSLTTAALGGTRPADYDPAVVARSLSLRDGSLFDLYAHLTAAHHFIDRGQPGRAQALLDHALAGEEKLAPFARDTLRCDYAWLLALHTPDARAARAWLDSAGPLQIDPATRLRAEAAVLLAEGRKQEAAAKAREGLHAAEHRSLSPVRNPYAADTFQEILRRADGTAESTRTCA